MTQNYRELTGKEKRMIKSWLLLSAPTMTRNMVACRLTVSAICLASATTIAHSARSSVLIYCQQSRSCKPYSNRNR